MCVSVSVCVCVSLSVCVCVESVDARQYSYDLGLQSGLQRRRQDVLAWVKKRRRTIRREDLISFLCGKVPPPRNARATPRITMVSPSRPSPTETSSSVETDLQPFREAIALHGTFVCVCVCVCVCVDKETAGPFGVSLGYQTDMQRLPQPN